MTDLAARIAVVKEAAAHLRRMAARIEELEKALETNPPSSPETP
jgi:hypothetical protein